MSSGPFNQKSLSDFVYYSLVFKNHLMNLEFVRSARTLSSPSRSRFASIIRAFQLLVCLLAEERATNLLTVIKGCRPFGRQYGSSRQPLLIYDRGWCWTPIGIVMTVGVTVLEMILAASLPINVLLVINIGILPTLTLRMTKLEVLLLTEVTLDLTGG